MDFIPEISWRTGGCACMYGGRKKYKKFKVKSLICRGGWTPLKLSENYESFSSYRNQARYGVQYLVKEDNSQSNLLIKQFRILLYGPLPHLSSSSLKQLVYALVFSIFM